VCIHGFKSSWKMVTSGVPQGSVLGPFLFFIFMNDLDSHLVTSLLKFADDSKLFGKVNNDSDRDVIQQDLHSLVEWSNKWQMAFNTEKCKVMHLGKHNKKFDYYMNNQKLDVVNEEKDLGVLITDDLKHRDVIQQDVHSLIEWSNKWQMAFNTEKCKVMHLGKQNKKFGYYMNNQKLDVVNEEKDLGVLITDDLKPSSQCMPSGLW